MPAMSNGAMTLADLMRTKDRAELVAGRIVPLPLFGARTGRVVMAVTRRLWDYAEHRGGSAGMSKLAYGLPDAAASDRQSFSPCCSYHAEPVVEGEQGYIVGAPTFAVEVRNGFQPYPGGQEALDRKRADYFRFGSLAVWEVDVEACVIYAFGDGGPELPRVFRRGDIADAEPAVPGWRVAVDAIFREPGVRPRPNAGELT